MRQPVENAQPNFPRCRLAQTENRVPPQPRGHKDPTALGSDSRSVQTSSDVPPFGFYKETRSLRIH